MLSIIIGYLLKHVTFSSSFGDSDSVGFGLGFGKQYFYRHSRIFMKHWSIFPMDFKLHVICVFTTRIAKVFCE